MLEQARTWLVASPVCCVTIRADSVEGNSKVKSSTRTSKLRFTDNSIMLQIDVGREEKVILPAEKLYRKEILATDQRGSAAHFFFAMMARAFSRRAVR